ncbi:MAG TPA: hypothetical protein VMG99_02015 [Thermoplasmata archaeon]|jgi:uncharacterized membrane protein|nr:hypothetical protein [Thermoplasmata archaeon]
MIAGLTSVLIGGWQFLAILLLVFGLFLILAGVFTAYFGSGKSRTIGVGLLVGGLLAGILTAYFYHVEIPGQIWNLLGEAVLVIVAAVVGALIAVGIFLVAIMKS